MNDTATLANIIVLIIGALSGLLGAVAAYITSTRNSSSDAVRARSEADRSDVEITERLQNISMAMVTEIKERLAQCQNELALCKDAKAAMQKRIDELEAAQTKPKRRRPKPKSTTPDAENL